MVTSIRELARREEKKPEYLWREPFPFTIFGTSLRCWPNDNQSEFNLLAKSSTSLQSSTKTELNMLNYNANMAKKFMSPN